MAHILGKSIRNLPGPVLITGHTGFKGTWMTLLLQELGVSVIGYSLRPEEGSLYERANLKGNVKEKIADIRDSKKLKKFIKNHQPSVVIHMAAQPLVLESYKIPYETFDINVMGTANLLDVASRFPFIKAILVVTTDKVYKNEEIKRAFVETDSLEGKDPYSASKVATEAVVKAWQQITKVSGGPKVASVRAGNVIGGGDWAQNRLMPDIVRSLNMNQAPNIRNPKSTRPWQHALDPLRGYILMIEEILKGRTIESINFGPVEESLSVKEVTQIAFKAWTNKSYKSKNTTFKTNEHEAVTLNLNTEKAQKLLNWAPTWTQKESIEKTINWWRNVLKGEQTCREAMSADILEMLYSGKK